MNETKPTSSRGLFVFAIAALALAGGIALGWMNHAGIQEPPKLKAATALLEQARPLPVFSLTDNTGAVFDNSALKDKWTFMFFGYTSCPDICPITLSTLEKTLEILKSENYAENVQIVFVSVDPERDTQQKLSAYVNYFDADFIGITGSADALEKLALPMGIVFKKMESDADTAGNYLVDHSASILLADPQGKLQAVFSAPHDAAAIASDFEQLRRYQSKS